MFLIARIMNTIRLYHFLYTILLSATVFVANNGFAQKKPNPKKILSEAKEYIRVQEWHHAYDLYKEYHALVPSTDNLYELGILCIKMKNKEKEALSYFQQVLKSGKNYEKIYFYMARVYHINNKFDSAIYFYNMYKANLTVGKVHDDIKPEKLDLYVMQCNTGKKLIQKPIDVKISNIGKAINTKYHEFAPIISADETRLIFTTRRPRNANDKSHDIYNEYSEDIYMSEKDTNGEWKPAKRMSDRVNSTGHDASIAISPDGQYLYLYRGQNSSDNRLAGDIYFSTWQDTAWSEPKPMPKGINSKYWEPSASITENEMTFFFTSDRPDPNAQGGRDIYVVRKLPNGEWAEPKNLGPPINTPYDEDGPFIHSNGRTLYFSSNGKNSMGGFDIFISHYNPDKDTWSEPQNLGYPINTAEDDIYFVWSADGVRGYFSSERDDSYGDTDIYTVSIPEKELNLIVMKGKVFDEETGKPLGATIEVIDNEKQKTVLVSNSNEFNGRYTVVLPPHRNYGIRVGKNGYLFKSINVNIPDQFEYLEIVENIGLKKLNKEDSQDAVSVQYETLNNMFFSPENEVKVESESEINRLKMLLDADKSVSLEVAVHTDNSQDSLVSLFISQARADAIVNSLKSSGADDKRIIGVGYGSRFPIASNETEEGRKANNRIEYITLKPKDESHPVELPHTGESGKTTPFIDYSVVRPELKYNMKDGEMGIEKTKVEIKEIKKEEAKPGYKLELQYTIRFQTGTSRLEPSADKAIEEILAYLRKYPRLVLEVAGHTDNVGEASYNQKLSEKRAAAVAQMLSYKGVAKERLKIVGYGEEKPVADNNTPEGREKNRRTEFTAISWGVDNQE